MTNKTQRSERRADALSKDKIVEAAIAILDTDGEAALTFRALAARLSTGSGAIYWHVADKSDLLMAATDAIISRVMANVVVADGPANSIRAIALGVFDAIDTHPWVGAQLAGEPWQAAMGQILERIGRQLQALGVPQHAQFNAASSLLNFILGVAGQNAAAARLKGRVTDRSAFLASVAAQWTQRDPSEYPFVRQVAAQLLDHDDRQQFLAGIDLILAGIGTLR
ncbi:MAG: Transcriptional regulator, TetR family [Devosia sp.]|uniref:TetR/AcrR family transcriptional regulator n=1 Tax=Devosia sp. TaxID=1871048 RepID=UPI00260B7BC3|nr:TetR family transcriptional regulator [Devosia sp.]MDB5585950.1 Transcriptional regulator, TetR family [Devosia sp.]